MRAVRSYLLVLATATAAAGTARPQAVPVTTLARAQAEFPEGYANISRIRELPDGRVMILEWCERAVKALDLATGTETAVGRAGAGPGEYRNPTILLAVAGDSSVIHDPGNQRFLIIDPLGRPARSFDPIPTVTESRGSVTVVASSFNAVASDTLGRLYSREGGIRAGPSGMERMDSVAVERWDFRTGKRDTVAFFRLAGRPGPITPTAASVAFTTGVQWAVAADGRVALVHPGDYRVDFTRLRLTEGHRQEWMADNQPPCGNRAFSVTTPDGRAVTARAVAPSPPAEWPEVLPPFLPGAASFAPDGMLWVRRTVPAGEPATFDLIDPAGRVVHRVRLQPRSRLLGFGRASVYVARVDDDDLQYVQRHPLPARR
jgi:hypothetical protein